jgi:hypothetical protein
MRRFDPAWFRTNQHFNKTEPRRLAQMMRQTLSTGTITA